jgi:hypothetical protein
LALRGGELLRRSRIEAINSAKAAIAREAHVKLILDTIPDAMIVIDERGMMHERRVEDVKKLVEEASALALVGVKDKTCACASGFCLT